MMKFNNIEDIIREELFATWILYKIEGFGQRIKVATNQVIIEKSEPREPIIEESLEKLRKRISLDPLAVYEIVIKDNPKARDEYSFTYRFSESEGNQATTTAQQQGSNSSSLHGLGSIYEKLTESRINEEKTRYESALSKQDMQFQLLMKEQDLERRERALRAKFRRLRTLRETYESESERMSNAIGLAGTKLIEHFGIDKSLSGLGAVEVAPAASTPAKTKQEEIIENLATELFNKNLALSELTVIYRIVNTYLQQPSHPTFNIYKNDIHKEGTA